MKLRHYINSLRPKTLVLSVSPVLIASVYVLSRDLTRPKVAYALLVALCAVTLQAIANVVNDYFDHRDGVDTQKRIGPKRAIMTGDLTSSQLKTTAYVLTAFALILGALFVARAGLPVIVIGVVSLLIAYQYTARPLVLSRRGMGEVFAFVFFGPVAVLGTQFVLENKIDAELAVLCVGVGMISSAVMAINNMRDRVSDASVGKHTIATLVGEKMSRVFVVVLLLASCLVPALATFIYKSPSYLAVCTVLFFYGATLRRVLYGPIDASQNKSLGETAQYALRYSIVLSLAIMASHL